MTRTNDTADQIDATHRANRYPDDAPLPSIAAALEGQPLVDAEIPQNLKPQCDRCIEKNTKRELAGVQTTDEQLRHGDRVTVFAVHRDRDDPTDRAYWELAGLMHAEHDQLDFEDVITAGTALVRADATMHERPDGELFVVDVEVKNRSKTAAGPDESRVGQRREQYLTPGSEPEDIPLLDRPAEAPPADWPESDRRWLERLVEEHGPLSHPTYHVAEGW